VLAAFVCHRPDIGYVQGTSQLAACLLLAMDVPDVVVFNALVNILDRQPQRAFITGDAATVR
jgi:hypothetical protein